MLLPVLTWIVLVASAPAQQSPLVDDHVVVFGEEGRFGGWPANHGMWRWENELLVGLSIGTHKDLGEERHNNAVH